ncbi:MAG: tetratricopeptide repeat protein [Flavobacteriales bacterium]|nr:tetratricopeptide repeat protein [Flavobacteriales bacterium]MCB9334836.1 tetratricopeptide repeat protein [Flavobacteriales bacterium]
MKNLILILLLSVSSTFATSVADPNTDYQKANELYAQKKYSEAIEIYENLINNDMLSADIYYNLGNAYYKTNQIPDAILNYEKALKLQPDHEDAIFNLKIANTKTIDKIEEAPILFIENTWNQLVTSRTTNSWAYYTVGLIILALFLFISYLISNQVLIKKSGFYGGLFFFVFSLFCWLMANQSKSYHEKSAEAIIFTETVTVKSEPNETSEKLFTLHEGTKIGILETLKDWTKIKLPNGNVGWLKTSDVKNI